MKIYYLANARIPGEWAHSYQIVKMCEALANDGHEVELLAADLVSRLTDDAFNYYKLKNNFSIKKIICLDLFSYRIKPLPILFLLELYSYLFFVRLYLFFKQKGVVYTRITQAGIFFDNFVLELHDLPNHLNKQYISNLKKANKIIVLTSYLRDKLLAEGIDSAKIMIAGDSIDEIDVNNSLSKLEARNKLGLPVDKKIVLYAGSFFNYDWKGVDVLLQVASKLEDNILVVLVGAEPADLEVISGLNQSNILAIIKQPREVMPIYFRAADVLVLPNKSGDNNSEFFTSPLKLFEYMASKTAIVASDLPSIREVLNDNNSVLVKSNNPMALADGIRRIINESALANGLADQAFDDVRSNTWTSRAKRIGDFIGI